MFRIWIVVGGAEVKVERAGASRGAVVEAVRGAYPGCQVESVLRIA